MKNCKCSLCYALSSKQKLNGSYYCLKLGISLSVYDGIYVIGKRKYSKVFSFLIWKDYFEFHHNDKFLVIKNNNEILFNDFSLENLITYINTLFSIKYNI